MKARYKLGDQIGDFRIVAVIMNERKVPASVRKIRLSYDVRIKIIIHPEYSEYYFVYAVERNDGIVFENIEEDVLFGYSTMIHIKESAKGFIQS